jgi:hypothetical protein
MCHSISSARPRPHFKNLKKKCDYKFIKNIKFSDCVSYFLCSPQNLFIFFTHFLNIYEN